MKGLLILGIALIIAGGAALAYRGITYTKEESVLEIGPLEVRAEREETIPITPIVGWLLLAGGGLAVVGSFVLPASKRR